MDLNLRNNEVNSMDNKSENQEVSNSKIKTEESKKSIDQNKPKEILNNEKTQAKKKKTEKKDEPISLKNALDEIDKLKKSIESGSVKSSVKSSVELYLKMQKQKSTPDDLIVLLNKICTSFPESEMKVLLHIFADMNSKGISNQHIFAYILNECIEKLNIIGYEKSDMTDFDEIIHLKDSVPESLSYFFECVDNKNKSVKEGKEKNNDIKIVSYLYLSILIINNQKSLSNSVILFVMMERAFIEHYLISPEKSAEKSVGQCVPRALLSNNYSSDLASLYYLYSDYKKNCKDLKKENDELKYENTKIKDTLNINKKKIEDLNSEIDALNTEISHEKNKAEEYETERQNAEDRLKFENNRFEMQTKSIKEGIAGKYKNILGLELEGIEDILDYVSEQARDAIQERLDRMRNIMDEMGNE